jgi:hypothetical protein
MALTEFQRHRFIQISAFFRASLISRCFQWEKEWMFTFTDCTYEFINSQYSNAQSNAQELNRGSGVDEEWDGRNWMVDRRVGLCMCCCGCEGGKYLLGKWKELQQRTANLIWEEGGEERAIPAGGRKIG